MGKGRKVNFFTDKFNAKYGRNIGLYIEIGKLGSNVFLLYNQ